MQHTHPQGSATRIRIREAAQAQPITRLKPKARVGRVTLQPVFGRKLGQFALYVSYYFGGYVLQGLCL